MSSDLTDAINAAGAILSGVAAAIGIFVSYKISIHQKLLSQRQLILPLWEHISSISDIDPENQITPDIIKAVNTLELVALCCEGGMIDTLVIKRTFKEQFMKHYENIEKCRNIKGVGIDGRTLLSQNKAAVEFYKSLNNERLASDRLS